MSAFVVGHDHIDGLLTFAMKKRQHSSPASFVTGSSRRDITLENATEIGRILLSENERSVGERYPDCKTPADMPGTTGQDSSNYKFKPWPIHAAMKPVTILKACSCFDYQACETNDYRDSQACYIIEGIRDHAIRFLPGYDDAPGWELRRLFQHRPIAHVSADVADAFGMRDLPNVIVHD